MTYRWTTSLITLAGLLFAGFAFWAAVQEGQLRGTAAMRNTALTDAATTSAIKGQAADAIGTAFSYSYTDIDKTERAAKARLAGKAISQYQSMMDEIRKQASEEKLVLTTTVTDSGVKTINGDRAELLIFADQTSSSAESGQTAYSAAMFTVTVVRVGSQWKIDNIDTFEAAP